MDAAANDAMKSNKNSARTKTDTTIPAKQSAFGIRKLSSKLLGDRSRTSRTKLGPSIIQPWTLSPTLKGFFGSSFSGFVDFCDPQLQEYFLTEVSFSTNRLCRPLLSTLALACH